MVSAASRLLGAFRAYGAAAGPSKAAAAALLLIAMTSAPGGARADDVTIAALGDSLTQGYGLPRQDGFVPQLERWLEARGHAVDIVNAGVSGDTTAGGLSRVGWTLTDDVDGMIVALGGNDLLRGLPPETSRANLDGILSAARGAGVEVLLVGIPAPGNYGPDYARDFNAIFPALAEEHGALLAPDFLAGLRRAAETGGDVTGLMQPDGIHPSASGVSLIVEDLGPLVEELIGRLGPS